MSTTPQVRYGSYLSFTDSEKLPDRWSSSSKHPRYKMESSCLKFTLEWATPPLRSDRDFFCIKGNQSISLTCGVFYYENTIECNYQNSRQLNAIYGFINSGYDSRMCHRYLLDQPIYHGLTGSVSTLECSQIKFGPPIYAGDTIGCGIDFSTQKIFFTYNGQYLGAAYAVLSSGIYFPIIGFDNGKITASTNFGATPFKYNIDEYVQKSVNSVCDLVKNYQPSFDIHSSIAKHIYNYLIYFGYSSTAEELKRAKWLRISTDDMECDYRKSVLASIRNKNTFQAIQLINEKYCDQLGKEPKVLMDLLFFQFVDSCYLLNSCTMYRDDDCVGGGGGGGAKDSKDAGMEHANLAKLNDLTGSNNFDVTFSKCDHKLFSIKYNPQNQQQWYGYLAQLKQTLEYAQLLKNHLDANIKKLDFYQERVKRVMCLIAYPDVDQFNYPELISENSRDSLLQCVNEFLLKCAFNDVDPPRPIITQLPLLFKNNVRNFNKWKRSRLGPFSLSALCLDEK